MLFEKAELIPITSLENDFIVLHYDKDRTLVIHIIDRNNGIAVFEETNSGNDKKYYLMISADKIKSVPLIVNNCETQKQLELQFEEPDYIELLKTK